MGKKHKIRVDLRKNRSKPPRARSWTREYHTHGFAEDDATRHGERVVAKGELSRRRTIIAVDDSATGALRIDVDAEGCVAARVLYSIGANRCRVRCDSGHEYECTVRRVVRTLDRAARNAVVPGDHVVVRTMDERTGVIERVEPRHGVLSRHAGRKEHVIAANVDQAVIVVSAAQPQLKPGVIDRFIVSAERECASISRCGSGWRAGAVKSGAFTMSPR